MPLRYKAHPVYHYQNKKFHLIRMEFFMLKDSVCPQVKTVGGRGLLLVVQVGPDLHLLTSQVGRQRNLCCDARAGDKVFVDLKHIKVIAKADHTYQISSRSTALRAVIFPLDF